MSECKRHFLCKAILVVFQQPFISAAQYLKLHILTLSYYLFNGAGNWLAISLATKKTGKIMELSMCIFNLLGYFKTFTPRHYWIALVFCFFQVSSVFAAPYYGYSVDEAISHCKSGQSDNTCSFTAWNEQPACSSFVTAEKPYWKCKGDGYQGSWDNCGNLYGAYCAQVQCDTTKPQHWDADKMECACNDGFERNRYGSCVRPCDDHLAYLGKDPQTNSNKCSNTEGPIPEAQQVFRETPQQCLSNPILYGTGAKLQNETDYSSALGTLSITRQYLSSLGVGRWYWKYVDKKIDINGPVYSNSTIVKTEHVILTPPTTEMAKYCENESINPCQTHWDYTVSNGTLVTDAPFGYLNLGNGERLEIQFAGANTFSIVGRNDLTMTLIPVNGINEYHIKDLSGAEEIYNSTGKLVKMTDEFGRVTIFDNIYNDGYDDIDGLKIIDVSSGKSTSYYFDNYSNRVLLAKDPDGKNYEYDYVNNKLNSVKFPDGKIVQYQYSTAFPLALKGILDEENKQFATWGYDANGRANSAFHGASTDGSISEQGSLVYTLNGSDVVETVYTNAFGRQSTYSLTKINGNNLVTHVEGEAINTCLASDSYYSYDDNGYRKTFTDKNGNVTETLRNASGLIELERSGLKWANGIVNGTLVETPTSQKILTTWHATLSLPLDRTWYKWNADNQIWDAVKQTSTTYIHNRISTYTETDLQTQAIPYATYGNSRTWTYSYTYADVAETQLQQMMVNGPRSDVSDTTTYHYDLSGNVTSIVNAKGHTTTFANYNSRGQVGLITDANGNTTALAYDVRGRLITVTNNGTVAATYTYWANGLLRKVEWLTNSQINSLSYEYNSARHLKKVTASSDATITGSLEFSPSLLDGKWTQIVKKSAAGVPIAQRNRVFDELGRIMTLQGQAGQATQLRYDANDNLINENDALARVTTYQYDAQNHPEKLTDAEQNAKAVPASVNIQHDGLGQITAVTDQRGNTTAYVYDGFGNVIQQSSPDTGVTVFNYNKADNRIQKTDASGRIFDYTYDELNRLTREQASWPTGAWQARTYSYDATDTGNKGVGKLTYYKSAGMDHTDIRYNQWGVSGQTDCVTSAQCFSTTYNYNSYGKVTSVVYPSGDTVEYGYKQC